MNIKAIALSAIAAVSTIVAPSAVEAYQVDYGCSHIAGYDACVSYQDRNNPDKIWVDGPNGTEYIEASCYSGGGYDWTSYGPNSKQFNDYIVSRFCR